MRSTPSASRSPGGGKDEQEQTLLNERSFSRYHARPTGFRGAFHRYTVHFITTCQPRSPLFPLFYDFPQGKRK